jgi:ubiquitin-protein ligase
MSTLYERRVEQEWRLLQELANLNPELIQDCLRCKESGIEVFRFTLRHTQALVERDGELQVIDEHRVSIYFPRFFPSVPMEASLARPVFHPNVHPEAGFVCLWNNFSSRDTVAQGVRQLQRVISWDLCNDAADDLMQPEALEWHKRKAWASDCHELPLEYLRPRDTFFNSLPGSGGETRKRLL